MTALHGKVMVVTGASSGVGEAAVRMLHDRGARVVAIGRSETQTRKIGGELSIPTYTVDFADLASVRRCAAILHNDLDRIDILALNAGAVVPSDHLTVDGLEPNLQVNAIGPWLLLRLLAERIDLGRVLSTSSPTHKKAALDLDVLNVKGRLGWHAVYARAKLVHALLLREFGKRHPGIDVGDFHPGIIASGMGRYMGIWGSLLTVIARPFLNTPQDGAHRMLALIERDEPLAGGYFEEGRRSSGSPLLHDQALARLIWSWSEDRISRLTDCEASAGGNAG